MKVALKSEGAVAPRVKRVLAAVLPRLRKLLPEAEVEHVGATAIPGAVTKGDLDVVVRVSRKAFRSSVEMLKDHFEVKQPENWTKSFASFGDDAGYDLPLGVQLVTKEGSHDFLTFIRDYLISNPKALVDYNELKVRHAPGGPERYWKAKNAFFVRILALRPTTKQRKAPNQSPQPTRGSVTRRASDLPKPSRHGLGTPRASSLRG